MKTIVVTGATSGIGKATVLELLRQNVRVLAVGRNPLKLDQMVAEIESSESRDRLIPILGNLETTKEVRELAEAIAKSADALSGIIHVAGTVSTWHRLTSEGYELQFAVNHLAPFALTHHLLPLLRQAEQATILVVGSRSHRFGSIDFNDIMMMNRYHNLTAYARSKLMNNLFVKEFARRIPDSNIAIYAFDPGLVRTEIGLKNTKGIESIVWKLRMKGGVDPSVPAKWLAFHALNQFGEFPIGSYLKGPTPIRPSQSSNREDLGKRLWEESLKLTGIASYFEPEIQSLDSASIRPAKK
jgi:retinol dehydrogenase 12